jgi:predicted transposase YbfD/YdcC
MCIIEEINKIKTSEEYEGYFYKVSDVVKIMILGLMCAMKTMSEIHAWSEGKHQAKLLGEVFGIKQIPCYSHFTNLVGLIDSEELNKIFMEFFQKVVGNVAGKTIAFDEKTVCSTTNKKKFKSPLHIASAFVIENGITIGQLATDEKNNEIPTVKELIKLLDITGATVVTDALHCQKDTAKAIIEAGADYVLSVKKNQKELYNDIAEMIDFKLTDKYEQLNAPVESVSKTEKNRGRIETRTAHVTSEVGWLQNEGKWFGVQSIGAVITPAETRYYISSRILSAEQLLNITRSEWNTEAMHWQLDVIFDEDRTGVNEKNTQFTLNILRKTVLNIIKYYRNNFEPKRNMVDIMRKCLHDHDILLDVLATSATCSLLVYN